MNAELRLQCLRNLTDLLSRTFKEQFVFPALGHDDIGVSFLQLAELWQQWLPQEALDTFKTGTYAKAVSFRIVRRSRPGFHIARRSVAGSGQFCDSDRYENRTKS